MSKTTEREAPVYELTPVLSDRYALKLRHVLVTAGIGLMFLYNGYVPLFHSDVWGHVSYGQWILENGRLPTIDPFVGLADGVPIVATAWLSQLVFWLVVRAGGAEALSYLFALTVTTTGLVLLRVYYLQTRRIGLAFVGVLLMWGIGFSRQMVMRPEIFGCLCFALLLLLLTRADPGPVSGAAAVRQRSRPLWLLWAGVPLLMLFWANLHGSFVVGFVLLGSVLLGRIIEVGWACRSVGAVWSDEWVRRWLLVTEAGVAATLINPYGMDLLLNTLMFPSNANLRDIIEWFPLEMVTPIGLCMGASWALVMVVLRHSRTPVRPAAVILLAVLSLAVCLRVRMVTWYAPAVVWVLMPHLADVTERLRQTPAGRALRRRVAPVAGSSFRYTLLAGLILWVCFAFSPISQPMLGGKPRDASQVYNSNTPRALSMWLRENPPTGQIANPQWWGDWLVWDGPESLQVMITTNAVHAVPPQVWRDYLAIARGNGDMESRLDRYRVNTVIVDKKLQEQLARRLRRLPGWETVYEDQMSLVARRVGMLAGPAPAASQSVQAASRSTRQPRSSS